MTYEAGNRFTPDTYFKTEVDSTSVKVKVTGELEGVEVSFDSGDVPEITSLSVTENGTYEAPEGTAYDPVTVEVPNSYTAADEGKVVDQGTLVSQTSVNITQNGTVNTTLNNEAVVNVPNSYSAADEGKVVSSGALVAQTSRTVTTNDTYDTTLNDEVVVAVPGPSGSISITQNDTYDVTNYASAVVNVPSGSDPQMVAYLDGSITELNIPEGITETRSYIVQDCSSITKIIFPSTITNIKRYTVYGSDARSEDITIVCKATVPPVLEAVNAIQVASNTGPGVIQVPAESVTAYQNAQYWSQYAHKIQAIPTT